jgi:hypothetical protein
MMNKIIAFIVLLMFGITQGYASDIIVDASGNGRNATNHGATPVYSGTDSSAYSFDGVDDYIDTGADWIGTGDVTVSTWIKMRSAGPSLYGNILSNGMFTLRWGSDNSLWLYRDNVSSARTDINIITFNVFQHLTITSTTAGGTHFYINGIECAYNDSTAGNGTAGTSNVIIGGKASLLYMYDGFIRNVQIRNWIATPAQVDSIYKKTIADNGIGPELVTNGAFSDSTGWGWGDGWYATLNPGKATYVGDGTSYHLLGTETLLTEMYPKTLISSITIDSLAGTQLKAFLSSTNYTHSSGDLIAPGTFTFTNKITTPIQDIGLWIMEYGVTSATIDNVSVKQVLNRCVDYPMFTNNPITKQGGNIKKVTNKETWISCAVDTSKIGGLITNFPVLVKTTSIANYDSLKSANDRRDVHFIQNGVELKFEREQGNKNIYWVKVPAPYTVPQFYMVFGDSSRTDGADRTAVWDSNFVMVQHMADSTTAITSDATSNGNIGTKVGANEPIQSAGKIGFAQSFDATDDYIATNLDMLTGSDLTISAWAKPDSIGGVYHWLVSQDNGGYDWGILHYGGTWQIAKGDEFYTPVSIAYGQMVYVCAVFDVGVGTYFYLNNVKYTTTAPAASTSANKVYIGRSPATNDERYAGLLDEVRISNSARSAPWIKAEYYTAVDSLLTYTKVAR